MVLRAVIGPPATIVAAIGRRLRPRTSITSFATVVPHNTQVRQLSSQQQPKPVNNHDENTNHQDGAWTLLAALEKAREAEGVRVSRLISSLETLLPRPSPASLVEGGAHMPNLDESSATSHTSDPAFFKLPSDPLHQPPTGKDIAKMLRSTRRGRRIDLSTVESLLRAATTNRFQRMASIVALPPLTKSQKLHVIGDLHGSLSDLEAVLGLTGEPGANNLLLFNGDLADRGDNGIEIISTVCALSLAYPSFCFVNRGKWTRVLAW